MLNGWGQTQTLWIQWAWKDPTACSQQCVLIHLSLECICLCCLLAHSACQLPIIRDTGWSQGKHMPHNMLQNIPSVLSVNHWNPRVVESYSQEARLYLASEEEYFLPSRMHCYEGLEILSCLSVISIEIDFVYNSLLRILKLFQFTQMAAHFSFCFSGHRISHRWGPVLIKGCFVESWARTSRVVQGKQENHDTLKGGQDSTYWLLA